jgi:hypothetical protein
VRSGSEAEASALLDEILARRRANPTGVMAGYWTALSALSLERLGRRGEILALGEVEGSRFLEAALAIDDDRFDAAAGVLGEIGVPQLEAEVLVLAARERRAEKDEGGAEDRLRRARELLAGLGATARLRQLDGERVSD